MDKLTTHDILRFLDQYLDYGYESKEEMILVSLDLLRHALRIEHTQHLDKL